MSEDAAARKVAAAVESFAGRWPDALAAAQPRLERTFRLRSLTIELLRRDTDAELAIGICDPSCPGCPLVFTNLAFREKTGYANALGESIQITDLHGDDWCDSLHRKEYEDLRSFCSGSPCSEDFWVAAMLHETQGGARVFDLLHLSWVVVDGRSYIFAVWDFLDCHLPTILRKVPAVGDEGSAVRRDAVDEATFFKSLHDFLQQLQPTVRQQMSANGRDCKEMVVQSINEFMKGNTNEFEGDHWIPRLGQKAAWMFEQEVKWTGVLEQVKHSLYQVFDVTETCEDVVACAVTDPGFEDCPLVYISREFEKLSGYSRDWVLGRNCRFLQPNKNWRNVAFNQEECLRMREFCKESGNKGARIVNLLVNEHADGNPFWNLQVMEHIEVPLCDHRSSGSSAKKTRPYIFAVQTKVDQEVFKLTELLAMDDLAMVELSRLRRILKAREESLLTQSLKTFFQECLQTWVQDFPVAMELPRCELPTGGSPLPALPTVGLEVTSQSIGSTMPDALEQGVRHFYVAFSSQARHCTDSKMIELEVRMLALKLAETLTNLKKKCLHYLRTSVGMTLMTPPMFVPVAGEVLKSARAHGCNIVCWMLDFRGTDAVKVDTSKPKESWQQMYESVQTGYVRTLGLCGACKEVFEAIQRRQVHTVPISLFGVEFFPGMLVQDHVFYKTLRSSGVRLVAFNIFGPRNHLLDIQVLREATAARSVDLCVAIIKWTMGRVDALITPKLFAGGGGKSGRRISASGFVSGEIPVKVSETDETEANVHRTFLKQLHGAGDVDFIFKSTAPVMIVAQEALQAVQNVGKRRSSMTLSGAPLETLSAIAPEKDPQARPEALASARLSVLRIDTRRWSSADHRPKTSEEPPVVSHARHSMLELPPVGPSVARPSWSGAEPPLQPRGSVIAVASSEPPTPTGPASPTGLATPRTRHSRRSSNRTSRIGAGVSGGDEDGTAETSIFPVVTPHSGRRRSSSRRPQGIDDGDFSPSSTVSTIEPPESAAPSKLSRLSIVSNMSATAQAPKGSPVGLQGRQHVPASTVRAVGRLATKGMSATDIAEAYEIKEDLVQEILQSFGIDLA